MHVGTVRGTDRESLKIPYATRPLSRCYLRSFFVKITAGAHKQPSKKYKRNLRTLKSKGCWQCRTKHEYYNNKAPHLLTVPDLIKVLNMSKTTQAFTSSTEM